MDRWFILARIRIIQQGKFSNLRPSQPPDNLLGPSRFIPGSERFHESFFYADEKRDILRSPHIFHAVARVVAQTRNIRMHLRTSSLKSALKILLSTAQARDFAYRDDRVQHNHNDMTIDTPPQFPAIVACIPRQSPAASLTTGGRPCIHRSAAPSPLRS